MSKEKTSPQTETKPADHQKSKKSPKAILNTVINVILVIAIILAAICTYVSFVSTSGNGVPSLFGMEIFSVQTDSMYPALKAGDLIISYAVKDASELRVGDIITYWTIINGERALNTHRIVEIYDGGGHLIFETKGDNNSLADSLTVHESEIVGRYSAKVPGLGKVLDYLQTSTGFLIVVVIPVALFFLYQLVQFFRVLFEYQSVKNRLRFEEEQAARLAAIDAAEAAVKQKETETQPEKPQAPPEPIVDKEALKAELREQMKAEMMAEMLAELKKQNAATESKAQAEAAGKEAPGLTVEAGTDKEAEETDKAEAPEKPGEAETVEERPQDEKEAPPADESDKQEK